MKFTLFCSLSVLGISLGWHTYTEYQHTGTSETWKVVALCIIMIILSSWLVPIKKIKTTENLLGESLSSSYPYTSSIFMKILLWISIGIIILVILACAAALYLIPIPI